MRWRVTKTPLSKCLIFLSKKGQMMRNISATIFEHWRPAGRARVHVLRGTRAAVRPAVQPRGAPGGRLVTEVPAELREVDVELCVLGREGDGLLDVPRGLAESPLFGAHRR